MTRKERIKKSIPFLRRRERQQGRTAGLPPGTPIYVGEETQRDVTARIITYTPDTVEEIPDADVEECRAALASPGVCWINVNGIHDVAFTQRITALCSIHSLTTEDIANTGQRPKAEEFEQYWFFVLKMLSFDEDSSAVTKEHISLILGDGYVLSFQEREGDVLDSLRERIRAKKGRVRTKGPDYLEYAIMDAIVDEYFVSVEKLGDHIERLDDEILTTPNEHCMKELHRLKREIVFLRKAVWPMREAVAQMEKSSSTLLDATVRPFLRDLYDHTIQIIDMVETYRDIIGGMHDTYLSSISNRMNDVMKVLTIMGTIFIPLTFVAGIYGMNFEYMPELEWKWAYFVVLAGMLVIGTTMLWFFKRRKWL
ncbi:MAG: magnesium/cobalt transporter CorA [Spirochaetales bacterium]